MPSDMSRSVMIFTHWTKCEYSAIYELCLVTYGSIWCSCKTRQIYLFARTTNMFFIGMNKIDFVKISMAKIELRINKHGYRLDFLK